MSIQPLSESVEFGRRYVLTDLLAVGGMAEIYLARQNAMAGFEKDVVIKRLKPDLARDERIRQMFLDEARIGAILNHTNIVHVYDVDEEDGIPYIAMEYIRGEELNVLCRRGLQLGRFLPLEHSVELLRQAASGMGYFHAKRGGAGAELEIVHCDISPTNLLVTEDGCLKVIDFGIAQAKNQHFRDQTAIPGKLSYMSPEQALRESLDARSDIFSLGVVAYEITVGKRLFRGPAQEVYKRLVDCDIKPPTFVRREFPGHLEAIVMRALERFPDDRYQSAYDLADDLEDFLREAELKSTPVRIARYLDVLNTASGGERREELISEAEKSREEDELDFDRDIFEGYQPAPESAEEEAREWDEIEESDREVAAALGIDPALLDRATRTPLPSPLEQAAILDEEPLESRPRESVEDYEPDLPSRHEDSDEDLLAEPVEQHIAGAFAEISQLEESEPGEIGPAPVLEEEAADETAEPVEQPPGDPVPSHLFSRENKGETASAGRPGGGTATGGGSLDLADLPWIPISATIVVILGLVLYFLLS